MDHRARWKPAANPSEIPEKHASNRWRGTIDRVRLPADTPLTVGALFSRMLMLTPAPGALTSQPQKRWPFVMLSNAKS